MYTGVIQIHRNTTGVDSVRHANHMPYIFCVGIIASGPVAIQKWP